MRKNTATIQDLVDMYQKNDTRVILNDGRIKGFIVRFIKKKIPTQTANPSGDNK